MLEELFKRTLSHCPGNPSWVPFLGFATVILGTALLCWLGHGKKLWAGFLTMLTLITINFWGRVMFPDLPAWTWYLLSLMYLSALVLGIFRIEIDPKSST